MIQEIASNTLLKAQYICKDLISNSSCDKERIDQISTLIQLAYSEIEKLASSFTHNFIKLPNGSIFDKTKAVMVSEDENHLWITMRNGDPIKISKTHFNHDSPMAQLATQYFSYNPLSVHDFLNCVSRTKERCLSLLEQKTFTRKASEDNLKKISCEINSMVLMSWNITVRNNPMICFGKAYINVNYISHMHYLSPNVSEINNEVRVNLDLPERFLDKHHYITSLTFLLSREKLRAVEESLLQVNKA